MYKKRYKKPLRTIKDGPVSQTSFSNWFLGNLAPPVSNLSFSLSFSLSLPLLFWLNSQLEGGGSPHLLTCPGKKPLERGSPRRGTLRYSSGHWWPT